MSGLSAEDFLTCYLCKNFYTDPRYLPCLHTFCKSCIKQNVIDTTKQTNNTQYICPLCYKPAGFPLTNTPQNIAENLPENAMVAGMVDVVRARNSVNVTCQPCSRKGDNAQATHWCQACSETMCDNCTESHQSFKKTMKHKTMSIHAMRQMSIKDLLAPPLCPHHEDEALNQYCDDHEELVCNLCITTKHRRCESVRDVTEVIEMKENAVKSLQDRLSEHTRGAEYVSDDRQTAVKQMDNNVASVLEEVTSLKKRINNLLEKCEKQIVTDLNDFGTREKERLEHQVQSAQSLMRAAGNSKELLQQAKENGSDIHLLQWMNKIDSIIEEFSTRFRNISTDLSKSSVSFTADNNLKVLTQNISKLGTLTVSNPSIPGKPTSRSGSVVSDRLLRKKSRTRSFMRDFTQYNNDLEDGEDNRVVSRKGTSLLPVYTARTPTDILPCWLTGVAQLSTETWVFADKNNKKLKLYDSNFDFKCERIMKEEPFDVAAMDHGGFAATIPDDCTVEFFSAISGINSIRTMKTTDKYYGISISNDRIAVTCPNMYPPAVRILMKDGTLIQHISPSDGYRPLFMKPLYVVWDNIGRCIFVSDSKKGRVICLEAPKFKRFEYRQTSLSSPRGIAIGNGGTFYICGWGTDNIQHVDNRGVLIREHLNRHDGVMGPQRICLSRDYKKLLVTLDPTSCNSDIIFVFDA